MKRRPNPRGPNPRKRSRANRTPPPKTKPRRRARNGRTRSRPRTKPGRPLGSDKLTGEVEQTILERILAGAWDYVAAESAGIHARTFREWVARGEGRHPTRPPTPKLVAFAKKVRQAKAKCRAAREIEVARTDSKHWLRYQGRSQPGRDGWTEPVPENADEGRSPRPLTSSLATPEEAAEAWTILIEAGAVSLPSPPEEEHDG